MEQRSSHELVEEDWKRMFRKEKKVNQELGRRLREIKPQVEEARMRSEELTSQLFNRKRHPCCKEEPNQQEYCSNCKRLEVEITRLERIIAESRLTLPTESLDSQRKNDKLTTKGLLKHDHRDVPTKTTDDSLLNTRETPPSLSPAHLEAVKETEDPETDESNQTDHYGDVSTTVDGSSLGDLFKYAVVLAGPTPAKQKQQQNLLLSDRLKAFDQNQSPQEQTSHLEDENTSRSSSTAAGIWKAVPSSGGSLWPFKRQSQTPLDNFSEDKVPSRRAATGLLSNLVSNGLRGGAGAPLSTPSTSPLPASTPANATTSPRINSSKLLCVYPPNSGDVQELDGLPEICFPYGEEPPLTSEFSLSCLKRSLQERHRTYRNLDSTFVLEIASTSDPTEITYAICVRCPLFPEIENDVVSTSNEPEDSESVRLEAGPTQCCLCLLSRYPFFGLFFKVLYGIAVIWNARRSEACMVKKDKRVSNSDKLAIMLEKPLGMLDFAEEFQGVMKRLKEMRVPSMGKWSRMLLSPQVTHLAFHRPHNASLAVERRHLLLEYAAPTLFSLLSVDQVLFLLGCLCLERKVLVVSDHVSIVSSCVLALVTLLHPLQWAGPVITVLPPRHDELLEAPVPLIAGRVSIKSAASIRNTSTFEDVIEMNMDENSLHMQDEDLVTYHELKLPKCDELVHELEPYSARLFGKLQDPDFPTVQQDEACKIMCSQIRHHIESMCTLALETDIVTRNDGSFDKQASSKGLSFCSRGSIQRQRVQPRYSAMVMDYITRFQKTQMFSLFMLQNQQVQNDRDRERER